MWRNIILTVFMIASLAVVHCQDLGDANRYRPIYKFDGASGGYCYPDYPSSSNDGTCHTTLNQRAPVFVRVDTCGGDTVYTYYLWYGKQQPCIAGPADDGHGNDWERVSVFVKNNQVQKVLFHQHSGQYTRVRGTFESEGERPVVYIGKIAHGSYHAQCDGKCSFVEFFRYGCLGTVNYCQGGCGYWDDFRNPGPVIRDVQPQPLRPGETIDGIQRPSSDVCSQPKCKGASTRLLTTAGCWQNNA